MKKKFKPAKQCPLCLKAKELRDSHLIAAGFFSLLRDETYENPNPFIVSLDYLGQTSKQAKQFLLCPNCEQRLNKFGENWVIKNAYHGATGIFPLRDLLAGASPIIAGPSGEAFDASKISGIEVDKLVYFAASVIWRASLCSWFIQKEKHFQLPMAGRYKEGFRAYLSGEAEFPLSTTCGVFFSRLRVPSLSVLFPETLEGQGTRIYRFYVPGLWFVMVVGTQLSEETRKICILRSPFHPICSLDHADDLIYRIGFNLYFHHRGSGAKK